MNKNSLTKNYVLNISYQILILFVPLITTPYVSRVLGAGGIGIYSFTTSIVTYFVIAASNGTTIYGQREIAYHQDNQKERSEIFFNIIIFRFLCVSVSFFTFICFFKKARFNSILMIQSISIISVLVDISWLFQGLERFQDIVIKNIAVKILAVLCIFFVVKDPDDLPLYVLINVCSIFLGNLFLWKGVSGLIKYERGIKINPLKEWRVIGSLFVPQIAIQVYTVLDKTMIGMITGAALENGYYEQAYKIVSICLSVVTALGTVMVPRIANTFAKYDYKKLQGYMYTSYRLIWFIGIPVMFGIWGTADFFVPWFMGAGYEKVPFILSILAILILAIGVNNVTGVQYLMTTKQQQKFTVTVVIGALVNFFLNLFLIPGWGAIGAAIASVAAESTIAIVQIIYVKDIFEWKRILSSSRPYFISGIIMFGVLMVIKNFLMKEMLGTLFLVASGAIVYFCVLYFIKDEFLIAILNKIKVHSKEDKT